jgi:hypothetical protein
MPAPCRAVRPAALLAAVVASLLLVTSCSTQTAPPPRPTGTATATATEVRPQYVTLVDALAAHGARVWVETDLLRAWLDGPERYRSVLDRVVSLAGRPGVDGVKIADELGYRDGSTEPQVRDFLAAATRDVHQRLPGRKVLVDFIVPELGCVAWWAPQQPSHGSRMACASEQRAKDPAVTLAAVDAYVSGHGIDVVDLSAGLREASQYAGWGITRDDAMAAAWDQARGRWGSQVRLQARKALAHPGKYPGTAASAAADVRTFVDIPLEHGAKAVDVWTWGQPYKGGTYSLTDPGLASNPLVEQLSQRRRSGVQLWTHMTPSSLQVGLDRDVAAATGIFSTVFAASGTG